ncbi:hypothetical protein J6X15_01365 [Candidatus Saccharibacteria bacterium]|nr:hypothetical protein [Candidatus Saccharibacteria bacterium]
MLTGAYQAEQRQNYGANQKKTKLPIVLCLAVIASIALIAIAVLISSLKPGSQELKIVDSGWSSTVIEGETKISIGIQVQNTTDAFIAKNIVITGIGYDANKNELFKEEQICVISYVLPGGKASCAGSLLFETDMQVDSIVFATNEKILSWTKGDSNKSKTSNSFEIGEIERDGEDGSISCTVKNNTEKSANDIRIVLILRKDGQIVGGTWSSPEEEDIEPGGEGYVILSGFEEVDYDDYELSVNGI